MFRPIDCFSRDGCNRWGCPRKFSDFPDVIVTISNGSISTVHPALIISVPDSVESTPEVPYLGLWQSCQSDRTNKERTVEWNQLCSWLISWVVEVQLVSGTWGCKWTRGPNEREESLDQGKPAFLYTTRAWEFPCISWLIHVPRYEAENYFWTTQVTHRKIRFTAKANIWPSLLLSLIQSLKYRGFPWLFNFEPNHFEVALTRIRIHKQCISASSCDCLLSWRTRTNRTSKGWVWAWYC